MTTEAIAPERVFYGRREAMVAEVAAFDPTTIDRPARECAYLIMCDGAAQWDTEWTSSKADAKAQALHIAKHYGVPAVYVA